MRNVTDCEQIVKLVPPRIVINSEQYTNVSDSDKIVESLRAMFKIMIKLFELLRALF